MNITIYKFGGKILSNYLSSILNLLKKELKEDKKAILVVSALEGITDKLANFDKEVKKVEDINNYIETIVKIHRDCGYGIDEKEIEKLKICLEKLLKTNKGFERDILEASLLSFGEKFVVYGFGKRLKEEGLDIVSKTSEQLGLITDENYLAALIIENEAKQQIRENLILALKKSQCVLTTGFIGKTKEGITTVLGRNRSDDVATFCGFALGNEVSGVHLIKNTKGITTADPKIIDNAKTVKHLTYLMAREAGVVVSESSIKWVEKANIPLYISFIENLDTKTTINGKETEKGIKMVVGQEHCELIRIYDVVDEEAALKRILSLVPGFNVAVTKDTRLTVSLTCDRESSNNKNKIDKIDNLDVISAVNVLKYNGYNAEKIKCSLIKAVGEIDLKIFTDFIEKVKDHGPHGISSWLDCGKMVSVDIPTKNYKEVIESVHSLIE